MGTPMTPFERAKQSIRRPAKCFWCPRPALVAVPGQPSTCCGGPYCRELEAEYQRTLPEAIRAAELARTLRERTERAIAKARRSFRTVETIRDPRFVDVPCAP